MIRIYQHDGRLVTRDVIVICNCNLLSDLFSEKRTHLRQKSMASRNLKWYKNFRTGL